MKTKYEADRRTYFRRKDGIGLNFNGGCIRPLLRRQAARVYFAPMQKAIQIISLFHGRCPCLASSDTVETNEYETEFLEMKPIPWGHRSMCCDSTPHPLLSTPIYGFQVK